MQSIFFLAYLAKLDWKKASDEVCVPVVNHNFTPSFFLFENVSKFRSSIVLPMSQAMIRAGVKTKEETKMVKLKSQGNFKFPAYIHDQLHAGGFSNIEILRKISSNLNFLLYLMFKVM